MIPSTTAPLTVADLERFEERDEWLGYGYLGARRMALEEYESAEGVDWSAVVAVSDELILHRANELGWTADQLFAWANSKLGRWAADVTIGSTIGASTDPQLRKLMSLEGLGV